MQRDDESVQKYWEKGDVVVRGQAETSFEVKGGVLYRVYKHPYVNGGKPLKQVMVPMQLRSRIMQLAHGLIMGGHMGIKKTVNKIQTYSIGQVFKETSLIIASTVMYVRRQLTRVPYRRFPWRRCH